MENDQKNFIVLNNLQDCIDKLNTDLSKEDKEMSKKYDEEAFLAMCHHGLGRQIRNGYGLWDETSKIHNWFRSMGIWHADDMSGIILTSFHRSLLGKDIDLEEQIKEYRKYWNQYPID